MQYPHPAVTADMVVFFVPGDQIKVLLIERGKDPFKGKLALPGGHVNSGELISKAAVRELEEETGVRLHPEQIEYVAFYDTPNRDPRGWYISHSFYMCFEDFLPDLKEGDDAAKCCWVALQDIDLDNLAFDHSGILVDAFRSACNGHEFIDMNVEYVDEIINKFSRWAVAQYTE